MPAAYLALHRSGDLARRADAALARLADCTLCPQACHVDRLTAAPGAIAAGAVCRTGRHARVAAVRPGFDDEPALVGTGGTGDILFSWCNLRCVYCLNADSSMEGAGEDLDAQALAEAMLELQGRGCHNIHLIGPSHVAAQILEALPIAAARGLTLPLVYNTGGYDSVETLRLLDGVVDIYTPDAKYADDMAGRRCSKVRDYASINAAALAEMARQVGPLTIDADGLARRGMLVRHLVLPRDLGTVTRALDGVAAAAGPGMTVRLLDTYEPAHQAHRLPELQAPVPAEAIARARAHAETLGLCLLDG
ncbi:radical SAM protein [Roseospira goensis]|uniref:Putative pyruvate formate lyase activating enzyme n=1 Tax=Roseospira goensis TaxID=391922 RepID=A0A7W6WKB0_9PROT|nr:radical SAM protein [Roseospira goensis]MBB4286141.1 putative pyruvate formate lyase activating enzyme [Roseospira goensis]